jgi:RNA polymerase sigma factor (sigma-70 family)
MKLTVLGAGCWGLTLAWLLTDNFDEVTVWGRAQDLSQDLIENKHNSKPLEVQLADKVQITSDMSEAIRGADIILSVVATSGTRDVCENLKKSGIRSEQILLNASKGIELPSLMRMSEVIKDVLPEQKIAILSGPTLAKEVLLGKQEPVKEDIEEIIKISNLSYDYKSVIMLYYYEDYSVNEIADILNISPSAVKKRLQRARQKLKIAYEKVNEEGGRVNELQ